MNLYIWSYVHITHQRVTLTNNNITTNQHRIVFIYVNFNEINEKSFVVKMTMDEEVFLIFCFVSFIFKRLVSSC